MDLPELKKIDSFLAGLAAGMDASGGAAFYEVWGEKVAPRPFPLPGSVFQLAGTSVRTAVAEENAAAFFRWDPARGCPCLTVEGMETEQHFHIAFDNGSPSVAAGKPQSFRAVDSGERLEVVLDLVARFRSGGTTRDITGISRKEFLALLESIGGEYPDRTVNAMKRLALPEIRELFREACADTPADELTDQLFLPLDGTYANTGTAETGPEPSVPQRISAGVGWEISAALDFYAAACRFRVECERALVIPFASGEAIGEPGDGEFPLKLRVAPDVPLTNGSVVYAVDPEEPELRGTFKIDVFDGDTVLGRMCCSRPAVMMERLHRLQGCLPKSPAAFLSGGVDKIASLIRIDRGRVLSPPQRCALGLAPVDFHAGKADASPETASLDASQLRAWRAAVEPDNPLVLVQGPPGTGKTFVLEQTLRELCRRGRRVLVTAPSNAAVDNICRRLSDLPLLRFGNNIHSIAPDVAKRNWVTEREAVDRFVAARRQGLGGIYAGTGVGLLRDRIVQGEVEQNGRFDDIVFDEAGMCAMDEFLLCAELANRAVLFGDHRQLPPFPLSAEVLRRLSGVYPAIPRRWSALTGRSALENLAGSRSLPVIMLKRSYRCQNPRLLRFSSTLFYDAGVKPSDYAEYYRLPVQERERRYPAATMRLYTLSALPEEIRTEQLCLDGNRPGLANRAEAVVCADIFYRMLERYRLEEISLIAPYRKQVELLTLLLSPERAQLHAGETIPPGRWRNFLASRVATVDSFQGAESDVVIICYVRSNSDGGIGFIDNPNRINVAHTRCRREMHIVGDIDCLTRQEKSGIFRRLERTFRRDGEIVAVTELPPGP